MAFNEKLKIGDILLCKSNSFIACAIQYFLPYSRLKWHNAYRNKYSSNHNGILGINTDGKEGVFESLGCGFTFTPIKHYLGDAAIGKSEIKFCRYKGISLPQREKINKCCRKNIGRRYDFRSYIAHISKLVFGISTGIHSKSRWYCTEAVNNIYRDCGIDLLKNDIPTPYTVEKRISEDKIEIIAEYYMNKEL